MFVMIFTKIVVLLVENEQISKQLSIFNYILNLVINFKLLSSETTATKERSQAHNATFRNHNKYWFGVSCSKAAEPKPISSVIL